MGSVRVGSLATLLLMGLLAGCVGTQSEPLAEQGAPPEAPSGLELTGTDCTLAGGHSVHPRWVGDTWHVAGQVSEPWQVADVIEDVGDQVVYSEVPDPMHPTPQEGHTWGHYHATLVCQAWALNGQARPDLLFGFVGPKVETPDFTVQAADNEYLATVVATNDEALYEQLQLAGIPTTEARGGIVRHSSGTVEVYMPTHDNGEYLSIFQPKELGPLHVPSLRLWTQPENANGTITPIALDLQLNGGTHYGAQGQGYFHHAATGHHYPMPGAYGKTAALMLDGFDLTMTVGERPDVVLDDPYIH